MSDDLATRLCAVKWESYNTAYGVAVDVPGQLERLLLAPDEDALQAAHELWCGLCHQHAYASNAAIPALPFLMDALATRSPVVQVEIMDIIAGLAVCSLPSHPEGAQPWVQTLRQILIGQRELLAKHRDHPSEDMREWAEIVLESLEAGA